MKTKILEMIKIDEKTDEDLRFLFSSAVSYFGLLLLGCWVFANSANAIYSCSEHCECALKNLPSGAVS